MRHCVDRRDESSFLTLGVGLAFAGAALAPENTMSVFPWFGLGGMIGDDG